MENVNDQLNLDDIYTDGDESSRRKSITELFRMCYERAKARRALTSIPYSATSIDRKNPDFNLLRCESKRLGTFHDWPSGSPVDPEAIAEAGMFFTGEGDRVQCVFCRQYLRNWATGDDPMSEHRRHFPQCDFVLGRDVKNVLHGDCVVEMDSETDSSTPQSGEPQLLEGLNLRENDLRVLADPPLVQRKGGAHMDRPIHPDFMDESLRLTSFANKPVPKGQNVKVLANAGFFYQGPDDKVTCFYCNGTLKAWLANHDPWIEHARYFPRCGFLRCKRDVGFINVIHDAHRMDMSGCHSSVGSLRAAASNTPDLGAVAVGDSLTDVGHLGLSPSAISDEHKELLEENKRLLDVKTCKVCQDEEVNVVFLPCGHLACCNNCAPLLSSCAICRSVIRGTVRVFLARA